MDTHTATMTAEAPTVEVVPQSSLSNEADQPISIDVTPNAPKPESSLNDVSGPSSFADALEAAFSRIDTVTQDVSHAADLRRKMPKDGLQKAAETTTVTEQNSSDGEVTTPEEFSSETDAEISDDPLENLSENFDWTPKAANRFKELKGLLKDTRTEAEQLKQQLKERESKLQEMSGLVENKDIEQLQKRVTEYERQKMFTDLESTYAFQQAVSGPLEALIEQADQIADKYEIDAETLIDVIALNDADAQDERLSEILPNASDRDKARIYRIIEDVNPILERRKQLYSNVEQAAKEAGVIEEQRQKQQAFEESRFRRTVTENVVERVTEKIPFIKSVEGINLDAIKEKAASMDPKVVHPVDFAYNAVAAQLLPQLVRQYVSLTKEISTLTDKLADYEDAEPKMSGGNPKTAKAAASRSLGTDGGFLDAVTRALGG